MISFLSFTFYTTLVMSSISSLHPHHSLRILRNFQTENHKAKIVLQSTHRYKLVCLNYSPYFQVRILKYRPHVSPIVNPKSTQKEKVVKSNEWRQRRAKVLAVSLWNHCLHTSRKSDIPFTKQTSSITQLYHMIPIQRNLHNPKDK